MASKKFTDYEAKYRLAAIEAARGTRIYPKTIIVASALESNFGNSKLSKLDNNFFGIKGKGKKYITKEQKGAALVTTTASFKSYPSAKDSFNDYVKLLQKPRYKKAGVLTAKTVKEQFTAIKRGGYATDANYINKLRSIYAAYPAPKPGIYIGVAAALLLLIYTQKENQ